MSVYLIRAGESGPVKIGHARNPEKRMALFQTAQYERLTLLRTWPGGQPEEAALHLAFSDYRIQGEWFRFCDAMLTVDPSHLVALHFSGAPPTASKKNSQAVAVAQRFFINVGGVQVVAKTLGLPRTTVVTWLHKGIPSLRVMQIQAAFNLSSEDAMALLEAAKPHRPRKPRRPRANFQVLA